MFTIIYFFILKTDYTMEPVSPKMTNEGDLERAYLQGLMDGHTAKAAGMSLTDTLSKAPEFFTAFKMKLKNQFQSLWK